jgi:uncharacterized membrane protein
MMKTHLLSYFVTLIVLVGLDFVWLGRMGDAVYRPIMGDMALSGFRIAPAVVFYLLFVAGVVYFAVAPALAGGGAGAAALNGAVFGLCAYATYDLTNQATLKNWSTLLSVLDMGWGTLLTAISATAAYYIVYAMASRG